ncbi:MAG TPA: hypothetical protein VFE32_21415 [Puia sp.]|jgi:hypothetical protein|nr:hypothetical protein [Puia sp.]
MKDAYNASASQFLFKQNEDNDEISIYEGPMKLHSTMDAFQKPDSKGKVVYTWYPFPRVQYDLTFDDYNGLVVGDGFTIAHEGLAGPTSFYKLTEDHRGHVKGFVELYESPGKELTFDSILFQFVNLALFVKKLEPGSQIPEPANELSFCFGDFFIVLKNVFQESQLKSITGRHGNILNGVVEVRKAGSLIGIEEAKDLMNVFFEFLSFCNGLRVKPILAVGILGGEKKYTSFLTEVNISPFSPKIGWMPATVEEERLNESWQKMYELCKEEEEKNFLELAIHWYLESLSMRSGVDASISLVQNALELLSSRILYEKEFILSHAEKGDRVTASSKINILLTWAGIPNGIPAHALELVEFAKGKTLNTGPEVITQIRNAIVHPDLRNRVKHRKMELGLKKQALDLALQYVELILLRLFRYTGQFHSRFSDHPIQEFRRERVPWVMLNERD